MEETPKKRDQTWDKIRSNKPTKPLPKSEQGEIKRYFLSPEELEHYRNMKPPMQERSVRTTAPRTVKHRRGFS